MLTDIKIISTTINRLGPSSCWLNSQFDTYIVGQAAEEQKRECEPEGEENTV